MVQINVLQIWLWNKSIIILSSLLENILWNSSFRYSLLLFIWTSSSYTVFTIDLLSSLLRSFSRILKNSWLSCWERLLNFLCFSLKIWMNLEGSMVAVCLFVKVKIRSSRLLARLSCFNLNLGISLIKALTKAFRRINICKAVLLW